MDDIWTSNLKDTVNSIKNNNNIYTTGKVVRVNDYIINSFFGGLYEKENINRNIYTCINYINNNVLFYSK